MSSKINEWNGGKADRLVGDQSDEWSVASHSDTQKQFHITHLIESGSWYRIGTRPSLCAIYSSFKTVEFSWNSTKSIARVGTSAIIIRRKVLATLVSVSLNMNLISCGARCKISTFGNL